MGSEEIKFAHDDEQVQEFVKNLLRDVRALERMLDEEWFETDIQRIGVEQELSLVDTYAKPALKNLQVLDSIDDDRFTTELAKYNVEINMDPIEFKGDCLSRMENQLQEHIWKVREAINRLGGEVILTGILPTIRKVDIEKDTMTPLPRYSALCKAINSVRGEEYELRIRGIDELLMTFDSPLIEASNTGYQVHLQVAPDEFARKYNIAQAVTGPVLACSVNSPLLFGKRLWEESRVAVFRQSIDTRQINGQHRESSSRVTFGNQWIDESILEIYQEDIARYRVLLSTQMDENPDELLDNGEIPRLEALQIHNSTIYRWNRPCYGILNGKAHLRIENRVLPSGPTVIDEVANSALWLGLLLGMEKTYPDITEVMDFADAKSNFFAASKMGLGTHFKWVNGREVDASELLLEELIPIAREGLEVADIDSEDISHYLGIIEERIKSGQTGSKWILDSYSDLLKQDLSSDQALVSIATASIKNQKKGEPVHKWALAEIDDIKDWKPASLLVEEFMTTDFLTVKQNDLVEFAANLLNWHTIRYLPVEDERSQLIGLITMRMIFRAYHKVQSEGEQPPETVGEIMKSNPITVHPEASIKEAIRLMAKNNIGCLPVVKDNRLVGLVSERNFLEITQRHIKADDH